MTIAAMKRNLEALSVDDVAASSINATKEAMLELNRQQLLEGRLSTGALITPSYYDDPYFKTPEAARKYSEWKDKITPNSKRPSGTPNLFIVGTYHRGINVTVQLTTIKFDASFLGVEISQKYGDDVYGLGGDLKKDYIKHDLRPEFIREIKQALKL